MDGASLTVNYGSRGPQDLFVVVSLRVKIGGYSVPVPWYSGVYWFEDRPLFSVREKSGANSHNKQIGFPDRLLVERIQVFSVE